MQFTYGINGNTLTLYPNGLDYSVTYAVYIPSGAIKDYGGIALPNSYSFNFTTINSGGYGGGGGSSSGSGSTTHPVGNSSVLASVNPSSGGTVNLGSDVSLKIPANALHGSDSAQVSVQKVDTPPAAPSGYTALGTVYQFSVGNQEHYTFIKPVTFTFTFDQTKLTPNEKPAVYYYDEAAGQWVSIGGIVSGNTITATADHFTKFAVMVMDGETKRPTAVLKDIDGHWAQKDIEKLIAMGVITGYPDGTFKPDQEISRAELTTILVKILDKTNPHKGYTGKQSTSAKLKFSDYNSIPDWAKEYIERGSKSGIINGYPDNTFRSENNITRAEATSMILRLLEMTKMD